PRCLDRLMNLPRGLRAGLPVSGPFWASWPRSPEVTVVADSEPVTAAQARPAVVRLPAEIDIANADSIGEQLGAASAPGVPVVIADMTATTFCDSAGINMLIRASKRGAANGTELRLLRACPRVL